MPRLAMTVAGILLLFVLFYGAWAAMLPAFEPPLGSLAAPLLLHPRLLLALIPAEGLLFGGAFAFAFRGRLPQGAVVPLMAAGAIGNSLVYLTCLWASFLGTAALAAAVAIGAVAYFLIARALLTKSPAKPLHVLLVGGLAGVSVAIPWQGAWSFVGLFVSKGLWWFAVLGIGALSVAGLGQARKAVEPTKSSPL